MSEHVSQILVGETNVMLTNAGFPCPGCVSVWENAEEFSRHILKQYKLTYKPITDSKPSRFTVQESPIPGSSAASDSISHSFTNTDTDTLTDTNIAHQH
ncbi:hypothetical protein [Parasitella parasitica]|uniref:Uncharacterized protein n=1 Tax=Parasitella parasitica TaxID=35722 RepID=A0A0B7NB14_9FUNG|nr:hypothetical protein [Parasitella parasitica]